MHMVVKRSLSTCREKREPRVISLGCSITHLILLKSDKTQTCPLPISIWGSFSSYDILMISHLFKAKTRGGSLSSHILNHCSFLYPKVAFSHVSLCLPLFACFVYSNDIYYCMCGVQLHDGQEKERGKSIEFIKFITLLIIYMCVCVCVCVCLKVC